ncbi:MAG: hypothetical protein WCK39_04350 [Methanomassiliicoccales archaeon]
MPLEYTDEDLTSRWEEFFEASENRVKVTEVADRYPELRSVFIPYGDLDRFDPDLASFVLANPDRALLLGEQAIRKMAQQGKGDAELHLRLKELPKDNMVDIRMLRSDHLGKLITVEGLVRKATEVRPKITEAYFRCFRCNATVIEVQESLVFKEPLECYKDQNGCGRTSSSTKFSLLAEESRYVDTQKIEMQENPEGLRGGAQPERLAGFLEDDMAGKVSPGDRVQLNGILRSVQKGRENAKSTLFDINLDVLSVEFKDQEYEEVEITVEDEEAIIREAHSPDIFTKIVGSISPTIYGYGEVKEAIALQLFGGSHKKLDDGTKVRGDIHILLVGDPGVAKCVVGSTLVSLGDGSCRDIRSIVDAALACGPVEEVEDGVFAPLDLDVMTFSRRGAIEGGKAVRAWKRTSPQKLLRFTTEGGRTVTVTPTHPLFIANGQWIMARHACRIVMGQAVAIAAHQGVCGPSEDVGYSRGLDWDKVISIEEVAGEEFVYDIEVDDSHIFVANGILSHNSQLLRYMAEAAPRGIYASGKSSSAAGLCVDPASVISVDGNGVCIGEFVEKQMLAPTEVEKGVQMQSIYINGVETLSDAGVIVDRPVTAVYRLSTPSFLVELKTASGSSLRLTAETKVLAVEAGVGVWKPASDVTTDDLLVTLHGEGADRKALWSKVLSHEKVEKDLPPHVYDLTVEGAHAFVANGILVHNTAAAVKDDFGEGRWTLEAGALVLADRGLACIAEEEKVVTAEGLRMIRDIRPGMEVFQMGKDGLALAPVQRVIYNGWKETIIVKRADGQSIECTSDHRVMTQRGWVEAASLTSIDCLMEPIGHCEVPVVCSSMRNLAADVSAVAGVYGLRASAKSQITTSSNGMISFPIAGIEKGSLRRVYDLTIEGEPNFLLTGGLVHNCIDELDKMTDQDRSSMHEAMESQCYDDETEVLTDSGWKFFKDVAAKDSIATLADGELVYEKPTAYVDNEYDGVMHRFSCKHVELLVTPNHNMFVDQGDGLRLQRADSIPEGKALRFQRWAAWKGMEVEDFEIPSIIVSKGPAREKGTRIPMDAWLEFLGHFLARGRVHQVEDDPIAIVLDGVADERITASIERCLQRMGLRHHAIGWDVAIFHEALATYLAGFGNIEERRVPRSLLRLGKRQLTILLDAITGRPYKRRRAVMANTHCTSSRGLADDLQEVALKTGMVAEIVESSRPSVHRHVDDRIVSRGQRYVVVFHEKAETLEPVLELPGDEMEWKEEYQGRIYCVEVPHHIIFVRRHGVPVWCGNTVSVAKAGITATLQCRCSMLGAANPKYGRFDDTEPLANQINMPPALLSRFDLIFALTDKPNLDRDTRIAQHIIKGHVRGEVRRLVDPGSIKEIDYQKILAETSNLQPTYSVEFMRKYVKYSKRIIPVLNEEAQGIIRDKYLSIRKLGEIPGASVPITARQLEAFIRLSEAAARIRLSNVVTKEDAQRAVRIVEYYLDKMAKDGGSMDVDKLMTGTTRNDRNRISIIRQLIHENSDPANGVAEGALVQRALEKGLNETDVRDSLKKLKQAGDIFEVARGHFKLISND